MRVLELFSGTESFSKVARERGFETFTIDNKEEFSPDLVADISKLKKEDIPFNNIDIVWSSPPCQKFSVATIGRNWNKDNTPKTEDARQALLLVEHTIDLIKEINPKYWFIENPRGKLRKLISFGDRRTVSYCRYKDNRMKPTDIWTNFQEWTPRPMCENGNKDHESAPRGSQTGTQGIKGSEKRAIVPESLCEEIFDFIKRSK